MDSILRESSGDCGIVVVDNASGNGSYERLAEHYGGQSHIHFLQNEENLGYAAGNNVGFRYAKNVLGADWIVLLNNDVTVEQKNFEEVIYSEYEKAPFYVAGPDIVTPEGNQQNPFRMECPKKKDILKKLCHDYLVLALMKTGIQQRLKKALHYDGSTFKPNATPTIHDFGGVLHGSCLIFSPDYIREFDGLYGGTFLYCEEEILCYILKNLQYPYSYLKSLQVTHRHAVSMKREIKDEDQRKMMEIRRRIVSYRKFLHIAKTKDHIGDYLKG
jgi:GT2 family glycosyltransferase